MLIHFLCGVCVIFAHFLVGVFANVKKSRNFVAEMLGGTAPRVRHGHVDIYEIC